MNYLHSPFVVNVGENIHNHLINTPRSKYQGDTYMNLSSHHLLFIYSYFIHLKKTLSNKVAFLIKNDSYFLSLFK